MKHPDSCTCVHCVDARQQWPQAPHRRRHRIRRRRNPNWKDDYRARKFWEACIIAELCRDDVSDTVQRADTALVAWRERWEKVPEAGPIVSPFTSDGNPGPDYCPPEEEGGNAHARLQDYFQDHTPPAIDPGGPAAEHRFIPVTDNRYCGGCGGGKLHPIHSTVEHAPTDSMRPYLGCPCKACVTRRQEQWKDSFEE